MLFFWVFIFGLSFLFAIPCLILFVKAMIKETVATWQSVLVMLFSMLCHQVIFRIAFWCPSVLFHYRTETYSGSWAHPDRFIDVHETSFLVFEALGILSFFVFPWLWHRFFKLHLGSPIPIRTLLILLPFYFLLSAVVYPNYSSVKTVKLIMTKQNDGVN